MSDFRFEPDEAGIRDVLNGPGVGSALTAAASAARERIQRHAPRGFMHYHRSVRFVPAYQTPDGIEAAVGVDSPVWHLPEYGTSRYPARAPIRKGVRDVGIELEE